MKTKLVVTFSTVSVHDSAVLQLALLNFVKRANLKKFVADDAIDMSFTTNLVDAIQNAQAHITEQHTKRIE